jgi:hypothetical protein
VGGVVAAALLVAACSGSSSARQEVTVVTNETQAEGGEWRTLARIAEEVEGFPTLADLGKMADVVVVAQATGIAGGLRGRGADLIRIRFAVVRPVSDWDEESIVVELDLPSATSVEALDAAVAGFPPALLALREKGGPDEAGRYRLVSSKALWTEQPGGGLIAPLAEDVSGGPDLAAELTEARKLDGLADHLEAARRDCDGECGLSQAPWNR